jgi:hypothetical protein
VPPGGSYESAHPLETKLQYMQAGGFNRMKQFAALLLAGMTLIPVSSFGQDRRYYDRDRRDYHQWNANEDRAYRHWLMEEQRERQYRAYNRLRAERRREYWRWRHEHPDWH